MYLVVIAWFYVTLMMAIAEATSPIGSVLGAIVTFVFYGLLPLGIVLYILATPARKRARRAAAASASGEETDPSAAASSSTCITPDAASKAAAATPTRSVAAVREKL